MHRIIAVTVRRRHTARAYPSGTRRRPRDTGRGPEGDPRDRRRHLLHGGATGPENRNPSSPATCRRRSAASCSKFADLGVTGSGQLKNQDYRGVTQEALAASLQSSTECRLNVFNKLVKRMLPGQVRRHGAGQRFGQHGRAAVQLGRTVGGPVRRINCDQAARRRHCRDIGRQVLPQHRRAHGGAWDDHRELPVHHLPHPTCRHEDSARGSSCRTGCRSRPSAWIRSAAMSSSWCSGSNNDVRRSMGRNLSCRRIMTGRDEETGRKIRPGAGRPRIRSGLSVHL